MESPSSRKPPHRLVRASTPIRCAIGDATNDAAVLPAPALHTAHAIPGSRNLRAGDFFCPRHMGPSASQPRNRPGGRILRTAPRTDHAAGPALGPALGPSVATATTTAATRRAVTVLSPRPPEGCGKNRASAGQIRTKCMASGVHFARIRPPHPARVLQRAPFPQVSVEDIEEGVSRSRIHPYISSVSGHKGRKFSRRRRKSPLSNPLQARIPSLRPSREHVSSTPGSFAQAAARSSHPSRATDSKANSHRGLQIQNTPQFALLFAEACRPQAKTHPERLSQCKRNPISLLDRPELIPRGHECRVAQRFEQVVTDGIMHHPLGTGMLLRAIIFDRDTLIRPAKIADDSAATRQAVSNPRRVQRSIQHRSRQAISTHRNRHGKKDCQGAFLRRHGAIQRMAQYPSKWTRLARRSQPINGPRNRLSRREGKDIVKSRSTGKSGLPPVSSAELIRQSQSTAHSRLRS